MVVNSSNKILKLYYPKYNTLYTSFIIRALAKEISR